MCIEEMRIALVSAEVSLTMTYTAKSGPCEIVFSLIPSKVSPEKRMFSPLT